MSIWGEGGYFLSHDRVCATYCQLAAGADGIPGVQADWKPRVDVWPRSTRGAEADVGFFRIPGMKADDGLTHFYCCTGCRTAHHDVSLELSLSSAKRRGNHKVDSSAIL